MKKIRKMDLVLNTGKSAYELPIIKEDISNIYIKNSDGKILRVNKRYRHVFIGKLLIGSIDYIDIY